MKKFFVLICLICFFFTSCQDQEDLVFVHLVPGSPKGISDNFLTAEQGFDISSFDIFYHAEPVNTSYTYGATGVDRYELLNSEQSIYLSQGAWEMSIICQPKNQRQGTSLQHHAGDALPNGCLYGTSGTVYVNLNTTEIVFYLQTGSGNGYWILDAYTLKNAPTGATLQYTIKSLASAEAGTPVTLDATIANITTSGSDVSYSLKTRRPLPAGIYSLKLDTVKDSQPLFTDLIVFTITADFETVVKGACASFNAVTSGIAPVPIIPPNTPGAENPALGNIVEYSGNSNATHKPEENKVNTVATIDPSYVYKVIQTPADNGVGTLPHNGGYDSDRISLGTGTAENPTPGNYGIDLNGKDFLIKHTANTSIPENTTIATVREGQSLTLFNQGSNQKAQFGYSWNQNQIRYDSPLKVEGGTVYLAPEGYSTNTFILHGPFNNDQATTTQNGVIKDYAKQGALNVGGSGGNIYLNGANNSIVSAKGITSYIPETGYTSLNSSANVTISMSNQTIMDLTADVDDNTSKNNAATNRNQIQVVTHGIEEATGIYLSGRTATGRQSLSSVKVSMTTGSAINIYDYWGGPTEQIISRGIYVSDIDSSNISISMNQSTIHVASPQYTPDSERINAAGIMLENVAGTATISLTQSAITCQNRFIGVYLKKCSANITLNIDSCSLASGQNAILIEDCTGSITINVQNPAGSADPISGGDGDIYIKGSSSATITIEDSNNHRVTATNGKYQVNPGQIVKLDD